MAEGGIGDFISAEDEAGLREEMRLPVDWRTPKFARSLSAMSFVPNNGAPPPRNLENITSQTFYRAKGSSLANLRTLNEIFLEDLHVGRRHFGKCLTLRTVRNQHESSGKVSSIIVEDTKGFLAIFLLLNVGEPSKPVIYINDLLHCATVFCLKEPHCAESKLGDCVLVCESPTDVVVINETHPRFQPLQNKWKSKSMPSFLLECDQKSAASLLSHGRNSLDATYFTAAVRLFLMAENVGDENDVLEARSGLCKAYFGQELYEDALTYAEMILCKDPKDASALKCAAECHYNLERYKEALIELGKLRDSHPDDSSMDDLLLKASRRQSAAESGQYNMRELFNASTRHPGTSIECVDYLGPVKLFWSGNNRPGLFTTGEVQPGTLLMVSKALAYLRTDDVVKDPSEPTDFQVWRNLVGVLLQKIWKYPQKYANTIYELYDGEELTGETSWRLTDPFGAESNEKVIVVNVQKIMDIVVMNCFGVGASSKNVNVEGLRNCENAYGIFQSTSFANHSCVPNASANVFNNVMFIRATQVIKKNDEVFISHMPWRDCYLTREVFCSVRRFQCECKLCNKFKSLAAFPQHQRNMLFQNCKSIYKEAAEVQSRHAGNLHERWEHEDSAILKALGDDFSLDDVQFPNRLEFSIFHDCKAKFLADSSDLPHEERRTLELKQRILALKCFGFNETELFDALKKGESLIPINSLLDENVLYTISRIIQLNHILDNADMVRDWIRILVELESIHSGVGHLDVMRVKYSNIIDLFIEITSVL